MNHDASDASTWTQAFLDAPYLQTALVTMGVVCDTFETACTWDRFDALHEAVTKAVDAAMKFIRDWPNAGAPLRRVPHDLPVRQIPVRRFPYHVVYLETPTSIRILAFAHDQRRPGYWRPRTQAERPFVAAQRLRSAASAYREPSGAFAIRQDTIK